MTDLRYAVRRLRNSPGFSAIAITTIALALGANTAMFSFVRGMLLSPLPYPESDRIVRVLERLPGGGLNGVSTLNYLDWANQNSVFDYMAAEVGWRPTLTGADEPLAIRGARVSAHYFDIFGTNAALGRTFLHGEDEIGKDRVVLLSHVLWENRFGSDPSIIGRSIWLDGAAHVVVGVLPKESPFDRTAAQIWKPLAFAPSDMTRDYRWLGASAKLKAGVTLAQARAEMNIIAQHIADAYPDSNKGWGAAIDRLADVLIGADVQTALTVLFAATLFVLLIGCANVANLTLARGIARQNEMAVRVALGAGRWGLVRLVLLENMVISICGGIGGIGVGYALMKWIKSLIPPYTLPPAVDIGINVSVLLFAMAAAIATGLVFGMAPAAQALKPTLVNTMKEAGHGTTKGAPGRRLRAALVIAQIALVFVLLVASGLLMRSFLKLVEVDPGFDVTNVLTAGLPIREEQHRDPVELNAYLASIRHAVNSVPGVRDTAITSALPLQGWGFGVPYSIAGRDAQDGLHRRSAFFKIVSPSYFDVLGIKLLAGRPLTDHDISGAPPVALINETLAKREFLDHNPIGHRIVARQIVAGKAALGPSIDWEIVGVVANEKINGLGDEVSPGIYVSYQQSPTYTINLVVRTGALPQSLQTGVRTAIESVNKDQSLSDVRTLEQIVNQSMSGNRFMSTLLTAFASTALVLAAVGIYGVVSYSAAQRTREIGIRAALGASSGKLRTLIFATGMRPTLLGLFIGLTGTTAATRIMSSLLYGVGSDDPLTMGVVAGLLLAVAAFACFLPAWRITRINPIEALRYE